MNDLKIQVLGLGEVLWDMLPEGRQCGGAPANVIYHLGHMGIRSAVISSVGNDQLGDELLEFLSGKRVDTSFISRNDLPTGTVNVTLQNGIPCYDIAYPSAWDAICVADGVSEILSDVSIAVFGTLAQRDERSRTAILTTLERLPESCRKVFDINLRQHYFDKEMIGRSLELADVLKINDEELPVVAELFGMSGSQEETAFAILNRWNLRYLILTLGAAGSMLFDGEKCSYYPVEKCDKIEDTVGCGDAFLAAWCGAVLSGKTPEEAMKAGSLLAAKVAGNKGAMF